METQTTTPGGSITFIKVGSIGIVTFNNLFHTSGMVPSYIVNYPSWFISKTSVSGALVGVNGFVAEIFSTATSVNVVYGNENTTPSLSGSYVVPLG